MVLAWAIAAATIHIATAIFQTLLAAGKPWGEYAWGGQNQGILPTGLRIGSAIAALLLLGFAIINLAYAGVVEFSLSRENLALAQKIVTGYSGLAILANAASRSRKERLLWTPVAVLLAICNLLLLYSGLQ